MAFIRPGRDYFSKYIGDKFNVSECWRKKLEQRRKTIKRNRNPQSDIILSLQIALPGSELEKKVIGCILLLLKCCHILAHCFVCTKYSQIQEIVDLLFFEWMPIWMKHLLSLCWEKPQLFIGDPPFQIHWINLRVWVFMRGTGSRMRQASIIVRQTWKEAVNHLYVADVN